MRNYTKTGKAEGARTELHDKLGLTGAEISVNTLPAAASVPFIHAHKENEEIYFILSGKGKAVVDGEEIALEEGDWIRIAPEGKRQFFASADCPISYMCFIKRKSPNYHEEFPSIIIPVSRVGKESHLYSTICLFIGDCLSLQSTLPVSTRCP